MQFRKKPIVIEAEQYDIISPKLIPGVCGKVHDTQLYGDHVHTLEGVMTVAHKDWVIKGVQNEYYSCKPDIFAATYEPVAEGDTDNALLH